MDTPMQDIFAKLRAPLPAKSISWRVGKTSNNETIGQALPYITPRVIQNLLDDIVGPANWRNSFIANTLGAGAASVVAVIELKIGGEWISKSDAAQVDSFKEDKDSTRNSKEIAIKGAYSDAFKRAAVMWGLGRYLYEFEAPWVVLEGGRMAKAPTLPVHMLPENERADAEAALAAEAEAAAQAGVTAGAEQPVAAVAEAKAEKVAEEPAAKAQPAEAAVAPVEKQSVTPAEKPADAPAAQQTEVQVAKQPDVTPEAKPAAAAAVQPNVPDEEALARERSAAMVDQEMGDKPADVKPAAQGNTDASASGKPEGLTADQQKTFDGMLDKIAKKLPTQMLRNYVNGPKAAAVLPVAAREYLLVQLDKADGVTTG